MNTILPILLIGGIIVGIVMFLPQIMAKFGSPSPTTLTQWLPAWLSPTGTNYGSGRGPGPATPPSQAGLISKTHTSPPASTGGGVGGPSKPVPGFGLPAKSNVATCGPGNKNAERCKSLKNSPGTYAGCCSSYTRAFAGYTMSGRPRKFRHMRSFNNMPVPVVPSYRVRYNARRVRKLPTVYQ